MDEGVRLSFLSMQITEAQLLISGLASGIAVVGVVIKWVVTSPERESAAYKSGVIDEQARCAEDIKELRSHAIDQAKEITKLRNALLRLAIASDLNPSQRHEIATALGYPEMSKTTIEPDTLT
jgi:hypothetical protein